MGRRFFLGVAALAVGVALGGAAWWAYTVPGPLRADATVVVPHGHVRDIAAVLAQRGVVRAAWLFEGAALATALEGPVRAAEFGFPAGASLRTVLQVLRSGRPVLHRLTIAEGLTSAQVAAELASADWLDGDVTVPPEGSVLPQTYEFARGTARRLVLRRAEDAMRQAVAAAWAGRMPGLPLRSPLDAVILASMVERETAIPAERAMVARVFFNRLREGMRLQSDPTAAYGAAGGGTMDRPLSRADLARGDAYNTYSRAGLPAAPICNPGVAAINAVLHPAQTAALYFVADGKGGHRFAVSLGEHDQNVRAARRPP